MTDASGIRARAPLQYHSAIDVAAENIRNRIYSGEFAPGAILTIKGLADDVGFSTTPVRDALKVLEREGLVRIAPRSGVYVRRITVDEVLEVYAVKQSLEPLMMRWAMLRGTPDELRTLAAYGSKLAVLAREQRIAEYVEMVEARYAMVLAVARSELLTTVIQLIDTRIRLMRHRNLARPGGMRRSARDHAALARAISAGDIDRACELTARFVRSATQSLVGLINETGEATPSPAPLSWPSWDGSSVATVSASSRSLGSVAARAIHTNAARGSASSGGAPESPLSSRTRVSRKRTVR